MWITARLIPTATARDPDEHLASGFTHQRRSRLLHGVPHRRHHHHDLADSGAVVQPLPRRHRLAPTATQPMLLECARDRPPTPGERRLLQKAGQRPAGPIDRLRPRTWSTICSIPSAPKAAITGFGRGIHHLRLGAPLAGLEGRVDLRAIVERLNWQASTSCREIATRRSYIRACGRLVIDVTAPVLDLGPRSPRRSTRRGRADPPHPSQLADRFRGGREIGSRVCQFGVFLTSTLVFEKNRTAWAAASDIWSNATRPSPGAVASGPAPVPANVSQAAW